MLHVNNRDGFTIAVSENKHLARIAKSTVLSDNAFSVVVPVLEQIVGWRSPEIRTLFESYGLTLQEWEKARTDRITVRAARWASTGPWRDGERRRRRRPGLGRDRRLRRLVLHARAPATRVQMVGA